jgi:hypothetical protein
MSIFAKLKNIFKRKPKQQEPTVSTESTELKFEAEKPVVVPVKKDREERQQKICPHCAAENDAFVSKCWLCKRDI